MHCIVAWPLDSGRVPVGPEIRAKFGWNPRTMNETRAQIVETDSVREALFGCLVVARLPYTSLCTGELNKIRVHNCFSCSPFYGRACRWAMLSELKPKGLKDLAALQPPGLSHIRYAECLVWSIYTVRLTTRFFPGNRPRHTFFEHFPNRGKP